MLVKNIKFKKLIKIFQKFSQVLMDNITAATLGFVHPTKNEWLNFDGTAADRVKKMLNLLKKLDG